MIGAIGQDDQAQTRAIAAFVAKNCLAGKAIIPYSANSLPKSIVDGLSDTIFLDLNEHQAVLEYSREDQVILVETGVSLAILDAFLQEKKQWLPLSFGSKTKTLLETIITGDGGTLEHKYGGPRRLVLGLNLVLSNGSVIRAGGRVVKNVTGYDLSKLIIGSYGYFALPTAAYLRLYARPEAFLSIIINAENMRTLLEDAQRIDRQAFPIDALELIDNRLLKEDIQADRSTDYCLAMRLSGQHIVLNEAIAAIKSIFSQKDSKIEIIRDESENKFWQALSDISSDNHHFKIEMNILPGELAAWVPKNSKFNTPFCFRVKTGRLQLFAQTKTEQDALLVEWKEYVLANNLSSSVSYLDADWRRCIEPLGLEAKKQAKIQNDLLLQLKKQFDPQNSFNPLISFGN